MLQISWIPGGVRSTHHPVIVSVLWPLYSLHWKVDLPIISLVLLSGGDDIPGPLLLSIRDLAYRGLYAVGVEIDARLLYLLVSCPLPML